MPESTQRFNVNRRNRAKWYTLDEHALAAHLGSGVVPNAAEPAEAAPMDAEAAIEGELATAMDGIEGVLNDGGNLAPCNSGRSIAAHCK